MHGGVGKGRRVTQVGVHMSQPLQTGEKGHLGGVGAGRGDECVVVPLNPEPKDVNNSGEC